MIDISQSYYYVKSYANDFQGEKLLRSERYYGQVSRVFSLANDVDDATAEAAYNDGVLTLKLPKRATASSRKLTIK